MKKLIIVLVLLSAAAFVFAQNPGAVIKEMSGTVELKKSGSADWVSAKAGDTVGRAAIVSTGFKSMAVLTVGSSTLIVRPLTRLSLEELLNRNETETININLSTGRIRVDVNPPAGSKAALTVQSPIATASVRGTAFEMDADSIQVLTGAVSYAPANPAARPVTVGAGQDSRVDSGTDGALSPMAAAEASQTLPLLPGQSTAQGSQTARLKLPAGSLAVDVTLFTE